MTLIYHPGARRDVREILDYYDERSSRAADRFFAELMEAEFGIVSFPTQHHFISNKWRRYNLRRFPYHIIYDIAGDQVRVLVIRHHHRHPDYGLRRSWR